MPDHSLQFKFSDQVPFAPPTSLSGNALFMIVPYNNDYGITTLQSPIIQQSYIRKLFALQYFKYYKTFYFLSNKKLTLTFL